MVYWHVRNQLQVPHDGCRQIRALQARLEPVTSTVPHNVMDMDRSAWMDTDRRQVVVNCVVLPQSFSGPSVRIS
jgi:hypothetical protein